MAQSPAGHVAEGGGHGERASCRRTMIPESGFRFPEKIMVEKES
jgi:hypothetical protein